MTTTKCQAKDPRTCRYHGTEIRMNEAQTRGDFNAYFIERKALEEMKPEVVESNDDKDTVVPFPFTISNPFKLAKARKNAKLEETALPVKFLSAADRKAYGLLATDIVAVSPRKSYGYTSWQRSAFKKTADGIWEEIAWGTYDEYNIKNAIRDNPKWSKEEARMALILKDSVRRKELKAQDS